jgi:Domain of unknown function (DUF1707)/Cell wall-active antibiotics response 4TMS YvqF
MELEPRPERPPAAVADADREAAAERLVDAAGAGRLTLSEFSDRVGAVWAAETTVQLTAATAGIELPPPVGTTKTVSRVVSVMGDTRRAGRWRLPRRLSAWSVMGDVHLDLTSVVCAEPEVELRLTSVMGDVEVLLPDGIEVELTGFDVMGDRDLVLAPVPRAPGTPLIRVRAHAVMGDVLVRSAGAAFERRKGWRRWLGLGHADPHGRKQISS